MKNLLLIFSAFMILISAEGQETKPESESGVKQFNLIKIGASVQVDVYYFGGRHYDERYFYGYESYYYPDGPNSLLYIAYEHIWEFPNKLALALEPKIGISFREFANHFMIGNDSKFYFANRKNWRMGMAVSTDYIYGSHESILTVPMDNGNYHQRKTVNMLYHNISIDLAIIPFQFKFKNAPIVIESQFALGGFSILTERSENYTDSNGEKTHTYDVSVYPYFVKGELKIGYVF